MHPSAPHSATALVQPHIPLRPAQVATHLTVATLEDQIPFARQTLMTADGKKVHCP